ncbi:MAG: translational GTPase TypA [Bacillota bacterium]|nr:translational GTPase TypA [Bacillota bacterium]
MKIINIAIIAHVDAGKSTLVDAFFNQAGVFRENEEHVEQVMDSDDIERERGITIYSKNCSINYKDYKINIVDTPGHADFSGEVERIIKTVDTVILLVDSVEGPMPQTKFVLKKALEMNLNPILFINKIDKKDQRAEEVVDMVFDLFVELDATEEQLDFPILYGATKDGYAIRDLADEKVNLEPLLETIVSHTEPYPDYSEEPLQLQISALSYDDYIGRLGIGRISKGYISSGQTVTVCKRDGSVKTGKIGKLQCYKGLQKVETDELGSGDIAIISGIADISIGETVCDLYKVKPMEMITIEEPTLSMNFLINSSPFAGRVGKFVTTRHLRDRLMKELEVNVALKVEELGGTDGFKVSGRGELHLSILIENMRREGYELNVSRPEVIFHKEAGKTLEPIEELIVSLPDEYLGAAISSLNDRKGEMLNMESVNGTTKLTYKVPTRGLLGFRSYMITKSRGEAIISRSLIGFEEFKGQITSRSNGVLVSGDNGVATSYSLDNLSDRGTMIIHPSTEVYEGMIIGINNRTDDIVVNPTKSKKLTNTRASGSDDAIKLEPPKIFTLEEAMEFIDDDEYIEVTPDAIRIRKKILNEIERKKANKKIPK